MRKIIALSLLLLSATVSLWGKSITVKYKVPSTTLKNRVLISLKQPDWQFFMPEDAFLEYDIYVPKGCPAPRVFGMDLTSSKRNLRETRDLKDQNGWPLIFVSRVRHKIKKGEWNHRRISLKSLGNAAIYEAILYANQLYVNKTGDFEARFRNIKITDGKSKVICDLDPETGSIPFPLIMRTRNSGEVKVEIPDTVSGNFFPDKFLCVADKEQKGKIVLHNFDPEKTLTVQYSLALSEIPSGAPKEIASDSVEIKPGETKNISIDAPPLKEGNYRPVLKLNVGKEKGEVNCPAITALTKENMAKRALEPSKGKAYICAQSHHAGRRSLWHLPYIREQGASLVDLWADWGMFETEPGKYDIDWIEDYLKMAESCGLKVKISLHSGYQEDSVPAWYRNQTMLMNNGRSGSSNTTVISYWAPARQGGLKLLNALLEKYSGNKNVCGWLAWNAGNLDAFYHPGGKGKIKTQPLYFDDSKYSQDKFCQYMKNVMKLDLEQVAARQETKLENWNELKQPQPKTEYPDLRKSWNDFQNYRAWSVKETQAEASELICSHSKQNGIYYYCGGPFPAFGRICNNFDGACENAVKYNGSFLFTAAPCIKLANVASMARHFNLKPPMSETVQNPAIPPQLQHSFYLFLSEYVGFSSICGFRCLETLSPHHGYGEYRHALERLANAKTLKKRSALVYSLSQSIIDPLHKKFKSFQDGLSFLYRMNTVGYDMDIFTDRTKNVRWSEYPVVIDTFSIALEDRLVTELLDYVKNGGKLVLFSSSGYFAPGEPEKRSRLLKALGCSVEDKMEPSREIKFTDGGSSASSMQVSYYRKITKFPEDAKIVAVSEKDKSPTVIEFDSGKGKVLLWAGFPDLKQSSNPKDHVIYNCGRGASKVDSVYPSVFDRMIKNFCGVSPVIKSKTDNIMCSLRKKGNDCFIIAFNSSSLHNTVRIEFSGLETGKSYNGYDLVRRKKLDLLKLLKGNSEITLNMQPYEVAAIQISPETIIPPIYDFPQRRRQLMLPDNAIAGKSLIKNLKLDTKSKLKTIKTSLLPTDCVQVPSGSVFVIDSPVKGQYLLELALLNQEVNVSVKDKIGRDILDMPPNPGSNPLNVKSIPIESVGGKVEFVLHSKDNLPMTLAWLALKPDWVPFEGKARISEFFEKNSNALKNFKRKILAADEEDIHKFFPKKIKIKGSGINFRKITGKDSGIVFLLCDLQSQEAKQSLLTLGVDYFLKLWLNGEKIFDSTKVRRQGGGAVRGEFRPVSVKLNKGKNVLIAEVASGSNGWLLWLDKIRTNKND